MEESLTYTWTKQLNLNSTRGKKNMEKINKAKNMWGHRFRLKRINDACTGKTKRETC